VTDTTQRYTRKLQEVQARRPFPAAEINGAKGFPFLAVICALWVSLSLLAASLVLLAQHARAGQQLPQAIAERPIALAEQLEVCSMHSKRR
jgi:hypothetical protein